jgi:lipopolysaccharide/colanic/teichoic acid biosynthesis glycosyltransferase
MVNETEPCGLPRIADCILAGIGLVLLSPLLILSAVLIAYTSAGPVLYRQIRLGRGGKKFILYKFRTMRESTGGPQITANDDSRITPIGSLLRATKLDELPELWNVLIGDMSLVGPRPEVPHFVNLEDENWKRVLRVRPGLTDPVTIQFRNEQTLLAEVKGDREQFYCQYLLPFKLRGHLAYSAARTWRSDVAVLCQTAAAILNGGSSTPPRLEDLRRDQIS